jgi:D-aspartate ligase
VPLQPRQPVLLLQADFCGTLAATRCLGEHGIEVTIADGNRLAPARWSRFATRCLDGPDLREPSAIIAWLKAFGAREERHVLLPTSDELAWLFALHRGELREQFDLYSPPVATIEALLDKRRLHALAADAGLSTPRTWYPQDEEEAAALSGELAMPVLLKPRTQVFSRLHGKGCRVERPGELAAAFRREVERAEYAHEVLGRLPEALLPMVQEFAAGAAQAVYTVSGFAGDEGRLFCARASRKVLQRPRQLGVGLCFEAAELPADLAAALERLCRLVRYHGAFDIEFLEVDGRKLLIDFNPRFYNQMAFEIARGLPAPLLCWLGATGQQEELWRGVADARQAQAGAGAIFCDHVATAEALGLQRLFGAVSAEEERRWRHWYGAHRGQRIDAVAQPGDQAPQLAEVLGEIAGALRHPRAFLRKTALGEG